MNEELKPIHIKRLKEFIKELLMMVWDEGHSVDDGDVIELAIKHKIIRKEFAPQYWRDEHDSDHWYTLQQWLKEE